MHRIPGCLLLQNYYVLFFTLQNLMCQRDRLKGIDNFYFGIQSWIQLRPTIMNIPTTCQWVHLWPDEEFKTLRTKCCLHFGLDWSKKEERGGLYIVLCMHSYMLKVIISLTFPDTYDNKLAHMVPALVTMTQSVQDKLSFVCSAAMESSLYYQVRPLAKL